MTKYLSMKYLVGVFALLAVLGMQSFQKAQEKQAKAETEEMIWFPASSTGQQNCEQPNAFDTDNGTAVRPEGCEEEFSHCCAKGYPISDCDEIAPGVYQLKSSPANPGVVIRYNPQ